MRASITVSHEEAEVARAQFVELAPEGFEETELPETIELAAYGAAAERVAAAFPEAQLVDVADDWADRWREFHRAVTVGPLWIGPPWLASDPGSLAVVIDPGRAFGTGAHPTTRLSLGLLLELERGSLLDVGCGSGVLSIAAARLGFEPLVAIDVDEAAVAATRENAHANGVTIEARQADALREDLEPADTGVANIALAAVVELAPRLDVAQLVTSGYLTQDVPELKDFRHVERRELDGWAADLYIRA